MKQETKHLSLAGVGPFYVITITILTTIFTFIPHFIIPPALQIPAKVLGAFFIFISLLIWLSANLGSKLVEHVQENKLVTTGVFAYTRNPIYAAWMFIEIGFLLFTLNSLACLAFPLYWAGMTIAVKNSEEIWLEKLYGDEYRTYKRKVNRCIPWFPKK